MIQEDHSSTAISKPRRKRVVYSCENCRSKKLKCDRVRPNCSNCSKHNIQCEYFESPHPQSNISIDLQLKVLKQKLFALEQKKEDINQRTSLTEVNFSHILSFPSLVKQNKYLNTMRLDTGSAFEAGKVPLLIEEQFIKEKKHVSDVELLRHKMKINNRTTTDLIKNYLNDKVIVWELINHFFNSELYLPFSFIDRNSFYLRVTEFLQKLDQESNIAKPNLILVASILVILRISYVSYYNCGYETYEPSKVIGPEALTLAILCFDESSIPFDYPDADICNLMLLIYYCQRFSPESLGPVSYKERISQHALFKKFLEYSLNFDPNPDDIEIELKRRRWFHFLEVERLEFVYSWHPIQSTVENYTTQLPTVYPSQNDDDVINEAYHERNKIQSYLVEFSKMINNVRSPSTIGDYEEFLKRLSVFNNDLNSILSLDSNNKHQRWRKTVKLINYLDTSSLEYMLTMHMFLYFDSNVEDEEILKRILNYLSRNTNQIITLSYFFDSQQQHFYNLREHFGYTIDIVPRILQTIHRGLHYQLTILAKLSIQKQKGPTFPVIEEIQKVLLQNAKVIVSSFGRISHNYSYAKRVYMILSFIVLHLLGSGFDISLTIADKICELGKFIPFSESVLSTILKDLTALTGDRNFSDASNDYEEPLTSYFGEMLSNRSTNLIEIDTQTIEQLEAFLNNQSFLN